LAALCLAEIEAATRSPEPIAPGVWIGAPAAAFFGPINFPDPVTSSPRYQFTCSLYLSGRALT
jgi:hypothetical protein